MLGALRYVLAMMVAGSHLWSNLLWWHGAYAVFGFYLISGYLMSLVINEVYVSHHGLIRYALNRFLRIYPIYLVVLFVSVGVALAAPELRDESTGLGLLLRNVMRIPDSAANWLANVTLVYPWRDQPLAVSQAWSLRVELVFYALMLVTVRRWWLAVAWLFCSALAVVNLELSGATFMARYTSLIGASFAFSLGASVYYLRRRVTLARLHVPIASGLFFGHLVLAPELWGFPRTQVGFGWIIQPETYGLYGSTVLVGYLLLAIVCNDTKAGVWHVYGKQLGDLAYAVFLLHWIAAALLMALGIGFEEKAVFIPLVFILINLLAFALHRAVEKPLNDSLRRRIRGPSTWGV